MNFKDTLFSVNQTINCNGSIIDLALPRIMGILNVTPDSFYDGGYYNNESAAFLHVENMISEGADIIDIGGFSSRPGSKEISEEEEWNRLLPYLKRIRKSFPDIVISVDTFRSGIAYKAVTEYGVGIINDISAGVLDQKMLETAGKLKVPFIMMHMQGTPEIMQINPHYADVIQELLAYFSERISAARNAGIHDIIIDPGFGFGKKQDDNFTILKELRLFSLLGYPVMAGLSRKSMVYKSLNSKPEDALNGTTVLNTLALVNGAKLLRVHDVKEAAEAVKLLRLYEGNSNSFNFM